MADHFASDTIGEYDKDFALGVRSAELFIAGMVDTLLQENELTKLETCVKASDKIASNVTHIMNAFAGDIDINSILLGA